MSNQLVNIHASWYRELVHEFEKPYFSQLKQFLNEEKQKGYVIYPKGTDIFSAFDTTPFENVKVVILGQDPYHGEGQAHGLCFSVNKGVPIPPSLKNIYKELVTDVGFTPPSHGYLQTWAEQGVLMLNATLTVRANEAGSHQQKGWETFTDEVIRILNEKRENLVFILWGKYAQNKRLFIDQNKHKILMAAHPSPFSAYNGFFGCRHFSSVNAYFVEKGLPVIDWQLPL
ncbi:MAG: uracil-DNA glycosylase [Bacteroidota bacterium]